MNRQWHGRIMMILPEMNTGDGLVEVLRLECFVRTWPSSKQITPNKPSPAVLFTLGRGTLAP